MADGFSYTGTMLAFNLGQPPFDLLAARRAVAAALDLDYIAGGRGTPGGPVPADRGAIHPLSPWNPGRALHRFDPLAARVAFAEAGVGAFRVLAPSNDARRLEAAKRIVRALGNAGARAQLLAASPREFDAALNGGATGASFDAAVVGLPALASYDPAFLRVAFGERSAGGLNPGGYRSARFERLADRVASAANVPARRRAVAAELRLLAQDVPAVTLFFGGGTFAYRPSGYDGWTDVRGSGILDKRSFLPRPRSARPVGAAPIDPLDPSDTTRFSFGPFILALAGLLALGASWWLWRTRRR